MVRRSRATGSASANEVAQNYGSRPAPFSLTPIRSGPLPPELRPVAVLGLVRRRYELRSIFGRFPPLLPLNRRLELPCVPRASLGCDIGDPLTLRGSQGLPTAITCLCLGVSVRRALPFRALGVGPFRHV